MPTAYRDAVLADTPQLYYRLGEAAGTSGAGSVLDSSGNGRTATPTAVTFGAGGVADDANTAASFSNASGSHVDSSYGLPQVAAWSVEFWFQATATNMGVVSVGNSNMFEIGFNGSSQLQAIFSSVSSSRPQWYYSPSLSLNTWYHIVYTYDSATNTVALYVDGSLYNTWNLGSGGNANFGGGVFTLGESQYDWSNRFTGTLDEFAYYNYALPVARIQAHYQASISTVQIPSRARVPSMYVEQVIKPVPRARIPHMYVEQLLRKGPMPALYYANLLAASSADFEDGTIGNLSSSYYNSAYTNISATYHYGSGSYSAQIEWSGYSTDSYTEVNGGTGAMRLGMISGYQYTFSAWIFVPAGSNAALQPFLSIYDNDGSGYQSTDSPKVTVQGVWTRVSVTRKLRPGASEAFIRIYRSRSGNFYGPIYVDKLMLDPSTAVTQPMPWRPGGTGGYLLDTAGQAYRQRSASGAASVSTDHSVVENISAVATRSATAQGVAQLYSASATPVSTSGKTSRTRTATGAAVVRLVGDFLADAVAIGQGTYSFALTSTYGYESGEPNVARFTAWYKFTAIKTGDHTLSWNNSYSYGQVHAYSGPSTNPTFATIVLVSASDIGYNNYAAGSVTIAAVAGTTYYLQFDSYYGYNINPFTFTLVGPPATLTASASGLARRRSISTHGGTIGAYATSGTLQRTRILSAHGALVAVINATATLARQRGLATRYDYFMYQDATATLRRTHGLLSRAASLTPPANDEPFNALQLPGINGSINYSDLGATVSAAEEPLADNASGGVGTVWFQWAPGFDGTATLSTGYDGGTDMLTILEAFVGASTDWMVPDPNGGWLSGSYVKVYRVAIPQDMTEVLTWTGVETDTADLNEVFDLMFMDAYPGDLTAPGWSPVRSGVNIVAEAYTRERGAAPSATAFGAFRAGTYYLVATQWPQDINSDGTPADPPYAWDPSIDFGTFTDADGNPRPAPFTVVEQVYEGFSTNPDGDAVGSGAGVLTWQLRPDETYMVRAYPKTIDAERDALTLTYTTVGNTLNFQLITLTMTTSPGVLTASVWDEDPGATISFYLDGNANPFQTVVLDDTGSAVAFPLSVPEIPAGPHSVTARSQTGLVQTQSFTVAAGVTTPQGGSTAPTNPSYPPFQPPPVNRWRLQDPVTGAIFDFPINPKTVDSPVLPRNFTPKTTTSPLGQHITFEGAPRAKQWTLQGDLFTKADVEALSAWTSKPYRVYITDDFGRTFLILVNQIATKVVRDLERPEHMTYTLTSLLFGKVSTETLTKPAYPRLPKMQGQAITYPPTGP